jgi:regulator of RNase E activity RraA
MAVTVSKVTSVKEVPVPGGTTVGAGMMLVNGDTNGVIVVPSTQTAASLVTALGIASNLKTIDLPARVGAFSSTGLNIFETLG